MTDVTLNIYAGDDTKQLLVEGSRFTIGSSENASLQLSDESLSSIHASINREGDRVWVFDESGKGTVFVNNIQVSSQGAELNDNDRLTIGGTLIVVRFNQGLTLNQEEEEESDSTATSTSTSTGSTQKQSSPWRTFLGVGAGTAVLGVGLTAAILYATIPANNNVQVPNNNQTFEEPTPDEEETPSPSPTIGTTVSTNPTPPVNASPTPVVTLPVTTSFGKTYLSMTDEEKRRYIRERAKVISFQMSNRAYDFADDKVIEIIKGYVDGFARRVGTGSTRMWGEDMKLMFTRAQKFAPHITKAFRAKRVPPVVGLYLVVVETEYHNIHSENFAGAAGLFQFIGPTAEGYGVPRAERTNVEKMAPAAAEYLNDRIAEFGTDPMSVALSIAGYNRSPDSVRRDLQDVMNSENKERSFWTLIANSTKLDHYFQGENIKYVPKYFGAAIVGENPEDFGLTDMRPLSTYEEIVVPAADLVNER